MRFQFPQFLNTKASLIGPLNFKQFIYVIIAGIIIFLLQFVLSSGQLIIASIVIGGISIALGFLKIEGLPLSKYIHNAVLFTVNSKRYIFKREDQQNNNEEFNPADVTLSYSNEPIQKEN